MPKHLSHENLRVYQSAIRFLSYTTALSRNLPRGSSELKDQLGRAALSICLNIAEGAGKVGRADSGKYYAIARGSGLECGAVLDACGVLGLVGKDEVEEGKRILVPVVGMLSKLCLRPGAR
jgi:four helix bundle protein